MHNVPAFLGAHMLTGKDKLAIARAMFAMSRVCRTQLKIFFPGCTVMGKHNKPLTASGKLCW